MNKLNGGGSKISSKSNSPKKVLLTDKEKEFLEMDLEKIKEIIAILKEHQDKAVKEGNFDEAEMTRIRLEQFRKVEKEKAVHDLKMNQVEEDLDFQEDEQNGLAEFNREWNEKHKALKDKWDQSTTDLINKQTNNFEEDVQGWEDWYPAQIKYSNNVLSLRKTLEGLVKTEQFAKAKEIQIQLNAVTKKEDDEWIAKKAKAKDKEIARLKKEMKKEMDIHIGKKEAVFKDFETRRARALKVHMQSFKNKKQEKMHEQKIFISMQKNITKTKLLMTVPGTTKNAKTAFEKFAMSTEKREKKVRVAAETTSNLGEAHQEEGANEANNGQVEGENNQEAVVKKDEEGGEEEGEKEGKEEGDDEKKEDDGEEKDGEEEGGNDEEDDG